MHIELSFSDTLAVILSHGQKKIKAVAVSCPGLRYRFAGSTVSHSILISRIDSPQT